MRNYLIKRVIAAFLTLFLLATAIFFLMRVIPGEPFTSPKLTPDIKENLEHYYGFDQPLWRQYLTYIGNLLKGDLGYSMKYGNRTVNDIIGKTFPFSADLGLRALATAISFGLVLGILGARHRGTGIDLFCTVIAVIGTSVPDFIIGVILQYFFGIQWGLLPVAKYLGFRYTILPTLALSFTTLTSVSRIMRISMLDVISKNYNKTALAKGISQWRLVWKHQIRNAIIPVVTYLGPTVASLLTGTFVIETLFVVPGVGKYFVESVRDNDYSMVIGLALFYGGFLVLCNLITDILYGIIDPRIRVGKK